MTIQSNNLVYCLIKPQFKKLKIKLVKKESNKINDENKDDNNQIKNENLEKNDEKMNGENEGNPKRFGRERAKNKNRRK